MKGFCLAVCATLLAAPAFSADEMRGCDAVNFGEDVLTNFPNAREACQAIMIKNDHVYVKYSFDVVSANKEKVVLRLLDRNGKGIEKLTLVPNENSVAKISGKAVKYADLEDGTTLNLYVEHNKWGLYADPDQPAMKIVAREKL